MRIGKRGPSQAETVIKAIIRKIVQRCQEKGAALSETLVGFMVKSVVLDPEANFSVERTLTQPDVDRLIDTCTKRLTETKSSRLETIKMQVYFDMNYTSRTEFISEHRRVIRSRLVTTVNEICESRALSREELQNLYRRIVAYILLESGLGSPTDMAIVRETTTALQSVFPPQELGTFLEFSKREKERHLAELTRIVSGIRLFNKKNGTGSSRGIEDLPIIIQDAINPSLIEVEAERQNAQKLAEHYTAIIMSDTFDPAAENMDKIHDALYNIAQWEVFLRIIYNELVKSSHQVDTLTEKLNAAFECIQNAVQQRTAVPTNQVYPLFIKLSELWTFFQEEIVLLSVFQNIRQNAKEFIKQHEILFPWPVIRKLTAGMSVKRMDEYLVEAEAGGRIDPSTGKDSADKDDITWVYPETLTQNMKIESMTFRFRSFCPLMLAKYGLLIPGSAKIGMLSHDDGFYVFSSAEAAKIFTADIAGYLNKISAQARVSTELINLVQLQRQFQNLAQHEGFGSGSGQRLQQDTACQTDCHILPPTQDKDYEWNEWEMRRKALKLANLRKCVTHSTQTVLSNFRRENETQVYLPKENDSQTKEESYTNAPKKNVYYAGLRGDTSKNAFKQWDITDYRGVDPN